MKMLLVSVFLLALAGLSSARNLSLVLLENTTTRGAVCLDGSPPGYYLGRGGGSGENKWILHQGGGGWCYSDQDCLERSKTLFGSSRDWNASVEAGGIFSDDPSVNGRFSDWNVVYLMYCDGSSFSGYREEPIVVGGTKLYSRGKAILFALIQQLLQSGMKDATDVILTGCSAGGLATYLHADMVPALLPERIKFKAMADAGYFLDIPTVTGEMWYREYMQAIQVLHNTSGGSDADCVAHYHDSDEWKCFYAPYTFPFIKNPIFVLNSLYDVIQLHCNFQLPCLPPNCNDEQMKMFDNFESQFLAQLAPAFNSSSTGIFADSCLIHCQTLQDEPWATYAVGGQTMRETFEDWYFEDKPANDKVVDCPFPCNPTCPASSGMKTTASALNVGVNIPPPPPNCTPYTRA